jgi:AcrR family transcriptional regulator
VLTRVRAETRESVLGVTERRARQKTLLRQEILDAARDILVREGYDALSMRKVADKIDYSPTAIYLHFKDRDDLVFSVCEEVFAGLVRELQSVERLNADPYVALKKGLRRYVEFGLAHPQHYLAVFAVPHHEPGVVHEKRPDSMGLQAFGFLPRLVGECVRLKKIRKVEVDATRRALWAAIHCITSLLIVMPGFDWGNRDKVIDQLIELLLEGLAARPRS